MKARAVPYMFLLPAMAGLLAFKLLPIAMTLVESMYRETFVSGKQFVGFQNYANLFTDPIFSKSLKVTLWFNLIINPLQIALGFILALLLNAKLKGIGVFRAISYVPISVSLPIAVIMWSIMFSPEQGVLNSLLIKFGLPPQPFYTSEDQALWVIILICTWRGVGYWAIFLLAGLQEVPKSLYESSAIDGASRWVQIWKIVIPMMKRSFVFVTVTCTSINLLLFTPIYLLTKGGPNKSTNLLMNESFTSAFVYSDMGRASAIVTVLLVLTLCLISFQFRLMRANH